MPVRRRQLLALGLGAFFAHGARAQRRYRMGYLGSGSAEYMIRLPQALFGSLRRLGFREGDNLAVERRFAEGRFERLPRLAAELVALKPDLMFTAASQASLAASRATSTIPIVFVAVSDPVGLGIVKSLARPGTNATGFSLQNIEVHAKRVQLLHEALPHVRRLAVLHNPLNVVGERMLHVTSSRPYSKASSKRGRMRCTCSRTLFRSCI